MGDLLTNMLQIAGWVIKIGLMFAPLIIVGALIKKL